MLTERMISDVKAIVSSVKRNKAAVSRLAQDCIDLDMSATNMIAEVFPELRKKDAYTFTTVRNAIDYQIRKLKNTTPDKAAPAFRCAIGKDGKTTIAWTTKDDDARKTIKAAVKAHFGF